MISAEHTIISREDGLFGGLGSRVEGRIRLENSYWDAKASMSKGVVREVPVLVYLPSAAVEDATHKAPMFMGT